MMIDKIDKTKSSFVYSFVDTAKDQYFSDMMLGWLQTTVATSDAKPLAKEKPNQDHFSVRNLISIQTDSTSDMAYVGSFAQGLASNIGNGNCKFTIEFPNEGMIYVESNVSAGRVNISMMSEQSKLRSRLKNNKHTMERSISRQLDALVTISISSI